MIYLVEDDDNIRELVLYTLASADMQAEGFAHPAAFWAAITHMLPEMILLDIMLPQEDGLTILKKLKASPQTAQIPVILLTAKGSEIDRVRGFEAGADDYLPKPFGMMELLARVRVRLRNAARNEEEHRKSEADSYCIGALLVSPSTRMVRVNGRKVNLTRKEFEVLCMLLENQRIVLTRRKLLDSIWGYSFDGESRTVDVHIRTLRQKLGEAGELIETIRGVGYRIGGGKQSNE